jgi:Ser/Thr protein kinase RdoA (MazF antagonist)
MAAGAPGDDAARRIRPRRGVERLANHLQAHYGVQVSGVEQLDLGVYRVNRADGEDWVARLFAAVRPRPRVAGDAEILRFLAECDYPAERAAADDALSELAGQPVLVTEYVTSVPRAQRRDGIVAAGGLRALGALLGRLHAINGDGTGALDRPGGAWHHLADGGPPAELDALGRLLDEPVKPPGPRDRGRYESLCAAVADLDAGDGLPEAFTHPDFVMANVVAAADGRMVLIDWAGAGRAPRMWSLAFLLFAVGFGGDLARVERIVAGYRRHVRPEPEELARLDTLIATRPIVFEAWSFATGRAPLSAAARGVPDAHERAAAIAARAREAFARS